MTTQRRDHSRIRGTGPLPLCLAILIAGCASPDAKYLSVSRITVPTTNNVQTPVAVEFAADLHDNEFVMVGVWESRSQPFGTYVRGSGIEALRKVFRTLVTDRRAGVQ